MEPHCLGKATDPARTGGNGRRFLEAVLWIARTGSPWHDLPPPSGRWNSVFRRFRDWVGADVFKRISGAVSDDPDDEAAPRILRIAGDTVSARDIAQIMAEVTGTGVRAARENEMTAARPGLDAGCPASVAAACDAGS